MDTYIQHEAVYTISLGVTQVEWISINGIVYKNIDYKEE
jgi:hypothetical protein